VSVVEVAVTARVRLACTGLALVTLMGAGAVQVTPGGRLAPVGQVTVTVPVKPPVGVTVTWDITLAPVAELRTTGFGL
jgi:hypothetical protein